MKLKEPLLPLSPAVYLKRKHVTQQVAWPGHTHAGVRKLFTTFLHEPENFAENHWPVAAHLALLLAGGNLSSVSQRSASDCQHEQMLEKISYLSTFADLF